MGWLRELMRAATPPIRSFGQVARQALDHAGWPADTAPQARSLASLLSKLDRGIELEWLGDRPEVQRVLADVLGVPLSAIAGELGAHRGSIDRQQRRFRFDDLRYARPIELDEEPLPPGMPPVVLQPARWDRLHWRAPSGAGRTLTGRWLEARGLASFRWGTDLQNLSAPLPTDGAVFVELSGDAPLPAPDSLPPAVRLCIASPWATEPAGWTVTVSPAPATYVDPLTTWLAERLPRDGHFEAKTAMGWLSGAIARGIADNLGSLLGLAGLIDEVGVNALSDRSLEALATGYVERRLRDASLEGSPDAQWLKRRGLEVLVDLAMRGLTDSNLSLFDARGEDAWIDQVPVELQQSVDTEWVKASLARAASRVTVRELERALGQVPPGAFRVVRGLVAAKLLRPKADGAKLALEPRWLAAAVQERAVEQLLAGSSFEWGEALLQPRAESLVMSRVVQRVREGGADLVDELLELGHPQSAAHTAALEACFRAAGAALLDGVELSLELLSGLWNEQVEIAVSLPGRLPLPRIEYSGDGAELDWRSTAAWYTAALAISEQLPQGEGAAHPVLRPWDTQGNATAVVELLDRLATSLPSGDAPPAHVVETYALVGRMRQSGALEGRDPHVLELPATVAANMLDGSLEWSHLHGVDPTPSSLGAIRALCEQRHTGWPRVARAMLLAWHAAGLPDEGGGFLKPTSAFAGWFYPHCPEAVLEAILRRARSAPVRLPFEHLGPTQWRTLVDCWPRYKTSIADATTAWSLMPRDSAIAALSSGAVAASDDVALRALWLRFPVECVADVERRIDAGDVEDAGALMNSAPASATASLVELLERQLAQRRLHGALRETSRAWLHARVGDRAGDFRAAYRLLADLERRARRVR